MDWLGILGIWASAFGTTGLIASIVIDCDEERWSIDDLRRLLGRT